MNRELYFAFREGERNAAEDAYRAARPYVAVTSMFRAGFDSGADRWEVFARAAGWLPPDEALLAARHMIELKGGEV